VKIDISAPGSAILRWRQSRGYTQAQLSLLSGVSQGAISMLETGSLTVRLSTLSRLARALGCRLDVTMVPLDICQVQHRNVDRLICSWHESGGYRCERLDPHGMDEKHWIGWHTINHARVGNGYTCEDRDGEWMQ